jgi:hypothetical protein
MNAELQLLLPMAWQSRRHGLVAMTQGCYFVEGSKVFFSRVDIPKKPLSFERICACLIKTWKGLGTCQVYGEHHEDR